MQDWVDFHRRADWYLDADLVVTVNRPGEENALSWRTRLVDFTWAGVPIATNGGDPLGEELIAAGAAARFPSLEPEVMAQTLGDLLQDDDALRSLGEKLGAFRRSLYWDVVTEPLARAIESGTRAPDLLNDIQVDAPPGAATTPPAGKLGRAVQRVRRKGTRAVQLARKVPAHVRRHGVKATAAVIRQFLARRLRVHEPERVETRPRIVVLSHRLDLSGAPTC